MADTIPHILARLCRDVCADTIANSCTDFGSINRPNSANSDSDTGPNVLPVSDIRHHHAGHCRVLLCHMVRLWLE